MSKTTFLKIEQMVAPYIQRQNTTFREAVSVRERVTIGIYMLAHGVSGIVAENVLRRAKSSCTEFMHEFAFVMSEYFYPRLVGWFKDENEVRNSIMEGLIRWKLPQIACIVDGTSFSIHRPPLNMRRRFYDKDG